MRVIHYFRNLSMLAPLLAGCSKSDVVSTQCLDSAFTQSISDPDLFIAQPNGISPNGDGFNDVFVVAAFSKANPQARPSFTVQRLKIMRPGITQPVYDNPSYQNNFDGHDAAGHELPEGDYLFDMTLDNNSVQGNLKIVRTSKACSCRVIDSNDTHLSPICQ